MQLRSLFYTLVLFFIGFIACKNPLDGVKIGLKDPLQAGVVEHRLYDPAGNPQPAVNKVIIAGPDADQVVTTLNTKQYKLNSDGVLLVAPSPNAQFSAQKPLRFSVVVEADDYLTVVQPVSITTTERQTRSIRRINLRKPPRTLNATRTTSQASSDGIVTTSIVLTTTPLGTDTDHAQVHLPANTKLSDRDGQPVGGKLTMALIHTNARNDEATSFIPGSGVMSAVSGRDGVTAQGAMRLLSVVGSMTVQIYNEQYALASELYPAISWSMELYPLAYNVEQNRGIQPGDSIPLFSYDEFVNRWQEETPGVVKRNPETGRLEYSAKASKAVAHVAGWPERICASGPVFRVSSKLANVDVNYLCKLIDVGTGRQVSSFYANINNGAIIRAYNQSINRSLKLQVFDETDAWGKGAKGGLIAESGPGLTCDQTPVAINLAALPVPPVMKLEFNFSCPEGKTVDESAIPAIIKTQYSDVGKNEWHDLITATRTQRTVSSYKLKAGRYYDFRASTDGGATWPLRQSNYLVDKPEWVLKINADMYCK